MAKQVGIYQFNGKLGDAVGSKARKGYQVVKRAPVATKNPSTKAQIMQRTLFAACTFTAGAAPEGAIVGMRPYANGNGMSIRNAFSKILQKSGAMVVSWSDVQQEAMTHVEHSKVEYSRGNQPNVLAGPPQLDTPQTVEFSYNLGDLQPSMTNLIVVIYCPDMKAWIVKKLTALSGTGTVSVLVPTSWNGMKVHIHCYTQCFENADQKNALYNAEIFGATADVKAAESAAKYSRTLYVGSGNIG